MDQPVDDRFADDWIFKQFKPSLGFDLRSDDKRGLAVALFEDVHQGSGLLVGIVSKSQIVEDQDLGFDQSAYVIQIAARSFGGLDFFEQKVDREETVRCPRGEPLTQSNGEMGFPQAGFTKDQKIFQVMEKAQLGELFDLVLVRSLWKVKSQSSRSARKRKRALVTSALAVRSLRDGSSSSSKRRKKSRGWSCWAKASAALRSQA